jgi:hypothetical protein
MMFIPFLFRCEVKFCQSVQLSWKSGIGSGGFFFELTRALSVDIELLAS